MTLDDLTQLALTHWPHAALFVAGISTKPSYTAARKAIVLLARAVVAHEDGDDKTALKDVMQAVQLVPPPPEPRVAPPGTVTEWPKR
jgi:hypothetical protein